MSFGEKGMEMKHWSVQNLEFAFTKLQDQAPKYGEDGDTYEKDGKYFVMGYEVQKLEYDYFLEKVAKLYDEVNVDKEKELDRAA